MDARGDDGRRRSTSSRSRRSSATSSSRASSRSRSALINSYVNPAHEEQIGSDRRAALPGLSGHALAPRAAGVPGVRADADGLHELLRPAARRDYVEQLQSALSGIGATAEVNILRSDAGLMTTREATRNPIYGVLSGPSGGVAGRSLRRAQGRLRQHPHVRHGRHLDRRRALPERAADDRPGDHDRPLPHQGAVGERAHGRRGRRLDRPRAGADEGAARRPAVGRRRARPGRVREGRRRADRDRRERRARLPAAAPARRRDGARRRGGARGGRRRSRTRWGSPPPRQAAEGIVEDRQREHGGRAAPRLRAARPRPARVRARRLRRRGAAARERHGARSWARSR